MSKKKENKKVKFRRMNWDAEFYTDLMKDNGFIIDEPAEMSFEGNKQKSLNGPQSPRYGTSYEDEQAFAERYRCSCGAFIGREFEGEICPVCNHEVKAEDSDINVTGWISLGKNRIINPYFFLLFCQTLGKNVFPDMINAKYRVTTDGQQEVAREEDSDMKAYSPYSGKGIDYFYNHYEEILEYFKGVKKNKTSTIDLLMKQKKEAFTSHIPIASTLLRPQSITSDTFYYNSMDKDINTLYSLSESLKRCEDIEKDFILYRIQTRANNMWETYFSTLNLKEGFIRGDILGGSLNYTSRNVIVPEPSLKDDEVDLSYHTFLNVFKYKIIYYIMKIEGITLAKAYSIWKDATIFNQKVYDIMQFIIENEDVRVLINRNPTLNFYSMLLMHIRKIKPDGNDYSLSVPLSILAGLNADFDGDILNIIGIVDKSISYMFRKFDPIRRMIISRDSGMINEYFAINKGQLIDLEFFCTMGEMPNDRPQTYPVHPNDNKDEIIWVEKDQIKKYKSGIVEVPLPF